MTQELVLDGKTYISSKRAAELSGYAQDYIGQLSRKQLIDARRIGGLWYVLMDSLQSYKKVAETYKPQPPIFTKDQSQDLASSISFDGKEYLSAARASEITGYNQDYVGQLARSEAILSKQIGNRWYVERQSLLAHKNEKDAMLGEVQSHAVGLRDSSRDQSENLAKSSVSELEPMRYFSDTADLMPNLGVTTLERDEVADVPPASTKISIRSMAPDEIRQIRREEQRVTHVYAAKAPVKRRKNPLLVATAGSLATIVIVLTVGFSSIRSSSTYTLANRFSNAALAGEVAALLQKAGDFIETHLVPPLEYIRK